MHPRTGIRAGRILLGLVLALAAPGTAVAQEPIVPTTAEDIGEGTCSKDLCSLRDAVAAVPEGGTIALEARTYTLTKGDLLLAGSFTIEGAGARATTIASDGQSRVAFVPPGSAVTVSDLTVMGGYAADGATGGGFRVGVDAHLTLDRVIVGPNGADWTGGGIATAGSLEVSDSTVSFNWAQTRGGLPGRGGGIYVESTGHAVLRNSTVSHNSADDVENQGSQGGGIYTEGTFSMEHVTIAHNHATQGGGLYQAVDAGEPMSMWNTLIAANGDDACGGSPSLIGGGHNLADDASCALDHAGDKQEADAMLSVLADHGGPTDTHALEARSPAIDAGDSDRCAAVDQRGFTRPAGEGCDIGAVERRPSPDVNTFLDGDDGICSPEPAGCTLREALWDSEPDAAITLREGRYDVALGALELRGYRTIAGAGARSTTLAASGGHRVLTVVDGVATVSRVLITGGDVQDRVGPDAGVGGGILVAPAATLDLADSAVAGNAGSSGGGIANQGALSVRSSTVSSNRATGEGSVGGGLLMGAQSYATLDTVTLSGNAATGAGGGIANLGGDVEMLNVTVAGNSAGSGVGAGLYGESLEIGEVPYGETSMISTLVAADEGTACSWGGAHRSFGDSNLADDDTCLGVGNDNLVEANVGIGPLDGGFGPTDVHPLLTGSPAIDRGNDELCPPSDQRGEARPQGLRCDIGAFEGAPAGTTLRVVTKVLDGPAQASDFTVRVFSGAEEVGSAPASATGTVFALDPGYYRVSRSGPDGYVAMFSDGCEPSGDVFLEASGEWTCTLELDYVRAAGETCVEPPFAGLTLVESAAVVGDVLRLNPDSGGLGAAWSSPRTRIIDGFTADFDFRITPGGGGADGLAFVVQNHAPDAIGAGGGGQGYHGMPNSLAVELDTYWNYDWNDPPGNHVAIHSRGREPNSIGLDGRLGMAMLNSIQDGALHRVRVVYSPGRMYVFVDDMTVPTLSVDVDLSSLLALDDGSAFVGFTAATGAIVEGHQIERWGMCSVARPTLRVVTQVVNDNGGTRGPGDVTVHVRSGGVDVPGSPRAGSTEYTLPAGTYTVAPAALSGYAVSLGDECRGPVTLAPGQTRTCTVTADDTAPQGSQPPPQEELPPPEAGKEVNAVPKSGTVRVRVAGTSRFVELAEGQQIPVGSVVDTTRGRVTIVAAGGQTADFFDGIFRLTQGRGAKPLTTLTLVEALSCPKAGRAIAAAKKKKRRLWGDGNGRFRTKGKHSAATVVGTRWLVEDRCASTLTKVKRGRVQVRDFGKRKNVLVKAGRQYIARSRG